MTSTKCPSTVIQKTSIQLPASSFVCAVTTNVYSKPIPGWSILAQEKARRSLGWICLLQPAPVQGKGLKPICSGRRQAETSHCGHGA